MIELIENLAGENKHSVEEQNNKYQYIRDGYKEISGEIERLEKVFVTYYINKLYSFFNFIYEAKKNIEEKDKAKELKRQKAEQGLLGSVEKAQS